MFIEFFQTYNIAIYSVLFLLFIVVINIVINKKFQNFIVEFNILIILFMFNLYSKYELSEFIFGLIFVIIGIFLLFIFLGMIFNFYYQNIGKNKRNILNVLFAIFLFFYIIFRKKIKKWRNYNKF